MIAEDPNRPSTTQPEQPVTDDGNMFASMPDPDRAAARSSVRAQARSATGSEGEAQNAAMDNAQDMAAAGADMRPDSAPRGPDMSTVAGQMENLFESDNPYITQAEERAVQYAHSRGMQNSTMAAQAGREAAIAQALPIAKQDAAHLQGLEQIEAQGDVQSRLQQEQFGYNRRLSQQDHRQNLEQITARGDIEVMLQDNQFRNSVEMMGVELSNALQLSEVDQTELLDRIALDHQNNLEAIGAQADQQLAANLQAQYLAGVTNRQVQASDEIARINTTEGLSATQQRNAVRLAQQRLEADIALLGSYYASSPAWDSSFSVNGSGSLPPLPGSTTFDLYPANQYTTGGGGGGSGMNWAADRRSRS